MLLEQNPACQWVLDREHRFQFLAGNPEPIFARPAAELLGRLLGDVLAAAAAATWDSRTKRVLAGETLLLRERTGDKLYAISFFPLSTPEGEIVSAAASALDFTPLNTAEQELRDTVLKMLKATQSERARLSKFLHDEVAQCLSAVGLQLDLLRMDFGEQSAGIGQRTAEMQGLLETVMGGVRDYSYTLNPDIVERAGLFAALDRLVGLRRKEFTGTLRLMADSTLRLPPPVGSAIYKITHEALENAMQHSGASQIEVLIKSTRSGPTLEIRDNGKGFDSADLGGTHRGLGLLVMDYYAERADLRLSVTSERGKGTVVRALYEAGAAES
jgi:signal transduction histidine kinase